ncbi:hypothetical protein FNF27_05478 [Cafeteria roenbergensis]|uniref:Protein kinase domain-containing protein n=1 Tax=Cafeteria roenbergensis TaxID=33653 RepID=A0A5A8E834_CAFRO|nr:hypothetical protein FNF27_05478 [Cafeteria roenbergensis]
MAAASDDEYADDFETDDPEAAPRPAAPEAAAAASARSGAAAPASRADDGFAEVPIEEIEIGKKLGGGGFAVVFLARWRGKQVAAKVLVDPKISDELRTEFLNELRVMKSLHHPGIVRCVAACSTPPRMAFVMELCGDSLFSVLHTPAECHWRGAAKRIPEAQTVRWATGVAEAIAFLHAQSPRIVHRDLKSHNLLLAADGRLKLCDFGLVHHPEPGAGTPQYMAPELLAGARSGFSDRVDVFAFGVLLWEMLARRVPYAGWRQEDIVSGVQAGERPPMSDIAEGRASPALRALIQRCWDGDATKRPSMADVVAELRRWRPASSAVASATRKRGGDALDALMH